MFVIFIISFILVVIFLISGISNLNNISKEFVINDYLKLRLEDRRTIIYVKNRPFKQCMYLLLNINKNQIREYDQIESIDQAAEVLDRSMERIPMGERSIAPEEEFRGHCSNLQAWAENDYDTRLLHRNLAFPLLKRLTEVGDPLAKKRFKDEIAVRYASGHPTVITYLTREGYLKHLNQDELECLLDDQRLPIFNTAASKLKNDFENMEDDILNRSVFRSINTLVLNFGMHNILFIISQILKDIPQDFKQTFIKIIYDRYNKNKQFLLIQFLNSYIQYFEEVELECVKYNDRIIAINTGRILDLSHQNIKNITDINGLENNYSNIEELDLSDNQIKELHGLEKYVNLNILKIANNQVAHIKGLDNLKKLQKLSLRNNNISKIEGIDKLSNLKHLDLSGNKGIEEIPESLNKLPELKVLKLENCGIRRFSENISDFFWMGRNYRYFVDYSQYDVRYYERTHRRKASSNNQLYKHFLLWLFKIKSLMKNQNITYQDIESFENATRKSAVWSGRMTNDFKNWLFNKPQMKITEFF